MKIVVTGGIGSGKSTVCKLLAEKLGYPVVYSVDTMVHEAYGDPTIKAKLEARFETSDRDKLSKIAFNNPEVITVIESIFKDEIERKLNYLLLHVDHFILEFPLLYEKGSKYLKKFDFVLSISAPVAFRVQRAAHRSQKTHDEILNVVHQQATDEERATISDAVICNVYQELLQGEVERVLNMMMNKHQPKKIGLVSGSFDPITNGHVWVIQRALELVDHVVIAIGHNSNKKYLLAQEEREQLVKNTIIETLTEEQQNRVTVDFIPEGELMVAYAKSKGAKFIFRGLRNATDLEYENQLNLFQKKIAPDIETIYLLTPREHIEISSSFIKSTLTLREWERAAEGYVPNCVFEKLKELRNQ